MKNIAEKILPYIPDRIIAQLKENQKRSLKRSEKMSGAVLFFDVAGFTSLTEHLAQWERGGESMQENLSEYYNLILSKVREYGGFAYQFAGDSVIIAMIRTPEESPEAVALRAATCALHIQKNIRDLNNIRSTDSQLKISIKTTIAEGDFYQIVLGSISNYLNSTITGLPVEEAMNGDALAGNDEIMVSQSLWEKLPSSKKGEPRETFHLLTSLGEIKAPDVYTQNFQITDEKTLKACSRFLHPLLLKKIMAGHQQFLGDFREVTSVFAGFNLQNPNASIKEKVNIWNVFYEYMHETASLYGGVLTQIDFTDKGNVFLILFGAPLGLEQKEIMAAHFALKVLEDIHKFSTIINLRIGISTGNSYCGDLGAQFRKGYTVVSKSINLASRLMTSVETSGIHIDSPTSTKLNRNFLLTEIKSANLKGIKESVTYYALTGTATNSREILSLFKEPMVGRTTDLEKLGEIYENCLNETYSTVAIVGEAGVGKSRLLAAFLDKIDNNQSRILTASCFPYEKNTPFYAWHGIINSLLGIQQNDDQQSKQRAMENAIAQLNNVDPQWGAALSRLVGLQIDEGPLTRNIEATQKKERLFQIILDLLRLMAKQKSIVICIEDTHWIDDASLELLQNVISHLRNDAVMILLVCRPWENLETLSGGNNFNLIPLEELEEIDALQLIRNKLNLQKNQSDLERDIYSNSRGNPFFIESIIHNLADTGILCAGENGKNNLPENIAEIKIPHTLQDVILARIDRLNENEQAVLKTAAVIGRIFMFSLLQKMTPALESNSLLSYVRALEKLDLTPIETENPLAHIFKHIVIRDVAYNTLLTSTRQKLHLQLAEIIEKEHQENPLEVIEALSYHFMEGGNSEKGLLYSLMAARSAMEQFANRNAIYYYEQALRVFQKKVQEANVEREYQIKEELAAACRNSGDFERARYLYAECIAFHKTPLKLAKLYIGMGQIFQEQGENLQAIDKLEKALFYLGAKVPGSKFITIFSLMGQIGLHGVHNFLPFFIRKISKNPEKYQLRSQVIMILEKIYFFKNIESVAWAGFAHVNLAERMASAYDLSLAYSNYATILHGLNLHKISKGFFEKSNLLAKESGSIYVEGLSYQRQGLSGLYLNDPDFLFEKENHSIQIFKQIGEVWETLTSMIVVAIGYAQTGELKKSNTILNEMKTLSIEIDSRMHLGWVLARSAYNDYMLNQRNFTEIINDMNQSIEMALQSQDKMGLITTYGFLASLFTREEKIKEALEISQKTFIEINSFGVKMPHLSYGYVNICDAAIAAISGNNSVQKIVAEKLLKKTLKKLNKSAKSFPFLMGPLQRVQASYLKVQGKHYQAISRILGSLKTLKRTKNQLELSHSLLLASEITGETDYRNEALEILNKLGVSEERIFGGNPKAALTH